MIFGVAVVVVRLFVGLDTPCIDVEIYTRFEIRSNILIFFFRRGTDR